MGSPSDQTDALLDSARVLDRMGVRYMLFGGIAVAFHSKVARATIDVNLAVDSASDRAAIGRAFTATGFTVTGSFAHSLNLRHRSGEPVQLAFDPAFDPALSRATTWQVRGDAIRIVSKADLILLKEKSARDPGRRRSKSLQDQADVELLRGDVPDPDEGW